MAMYSALLYLIVPAKLTFPLNTVTPWYVLACGTGVETAAWAALAMPSH
jgi:hypothetical protein